MTKRTLAVMAVAVVACRGSGGRKAARGSATAADAAGVRDATVAVPGDAWLRAPDPTPAQVAALATGRSLRCLLASDLKLEAFADDLTPALAEVIATAVVAAARPDGDGPTQAAWADVAGLYVAIDDRRGLRAAVEAHARIDLTRDELGDTSRALVGGTLSPPSSFTDLEVIRNLAIAGDVAGAAARYDRPEARPEHDEDDYYVVRRVGALVALGRIDAARAIIAAAAPERQAELIGAWLETALMRDAGVPEAVAALEAMLAAAPAGGGLRWSPGRALRLARRRGHVAALARLRPALARAIGADESGLATDVFEDALATGDDGVTTVLAPRLRPAWRTSTELLYLGSLPTAIAQVSVDSPFFRDDLARLWVRHAAEGGAPTAETLLAERACAGQAPVVAASGPPVPATVDAHVVAIDRRPRKLRPCDGIEAELQLTIGGRVVQRERIDGECSGACDAESQRAGQEHLDELQDQVDRGEASQGITDYNFTSCLWTGSKVGRRERVGERDVVILVDRYIGAHDIDQDHYAIVTEVCGALYASPSFGGTYAADFPLDGVTVTGSSDGRTLVVTGARPDWRGVLLRLTLPSACPGEPVAEVIDSEG